MENFQLVRVKVSWTALLALAHFTYLLVGATVFQILEREAESNNRNHFQLEKLNFLANYTCLDGPALENFVKVILYAWENGVNPSGNSTNPSNWDFSSSFFFAGTVVTTIGYGNLSPSTIGKCLSIHLSRLERRMVAVVPLKIPRTVEAMVVSLFFISGSLLFLVIPPLLFSYVEDWTFGEGFYFAFITLSTIGFGDYVVGTDPAKEYISLYRSLAGIWIIFALAWLALILNMGAQMMEDVLILMRPGFTKQEEEEEVIQEASKAGLSLKSNTTTDGFWKFTSSAVFAATVVTTIGYGNMSPSTWGGQIFCVFFALFGIPLNVVVLNKVGKYMLSLERNISDFLQRKLGGKTCIRFFIHLVSYICGTVFFFIVPMIVFKLYEGWSYSQAIYYCFITLSTIGFGDFVAGKALC
uniref:Potassium two pore domain channel subfamily K member 16 n=1 Tax=Oryzias melastigma TaxID=30732 RepID=A0A3B3BT39_ORYME